MNQNSPAGFPNEETAPGSSRYYAIRFAPADQRDALALLFALHQALMRVPRECTDPNVAHTKLNWWREQLLSPEPVSGHPIVHALNQLPKAMQPSRFWLEILFSGIKQEILNTPIESENELEKHCHATGSSLSCLLTAASGGSEQQLDCAQEMGQFIRRVDIIRDFGHDIRRHRCYLPHSLLEQHGIDINHIFDKSSQAKLSALLQAFAIDARSRLVQALSQLPDEKHRSLATAFSLALIKDALLKEIGKEDFRVLNQRTSLTPLRKLWISWRCNNQTKRTRTLALSRVK